MYTSGTFGSLKMRTTSFSEVILKKRISLIVLDTLLYNHCLGNNFLASTDKISRKISNNLVASASDDVYTFKCRIYVVREA